MADFTTCAIGISTAKKTSCRCQPLLLPVRLVKWQATQVPSVHPQQSFRIPKKKIHSHKGFILLAIDT